MRSAEQTQIFGRRRPADAIKPAASAKNIRINLRIDPEAARIYGDSDRLQQVIWNLVNNAIKFTDKGGAVAVDLWRVDTSIALSVSDNGKGISAEFLPYIFERFRQADGSTTRRYGGLGLGLALARHLVEAHGGTIRAESGGEGQGAAFTVMLPVQAVYERDCHSDRPSQPALEPFSAAVSLAGVTILITDDEPDARELISTVLEGSGAAVFVASSAAQALELLETEAIDVLISDVGMPDLDGYDLMRRVRGLAGSSARVPAIALTAYARELDRNRALEVGFQAHVAKPVEPLTLLRAVADLLAAQKILK